MQLANSTHLATVTATAWTTGSNGQQQQVHSDPVSILFLGIEVDFLFFGTSVYRWGIYGWIVQLFFILGVQWACFCLSFDAAYIALAPPLLTIPWMQVLLAVRLPGGDDLWWNLFDNPSCRGNPWPVVLSFPAAPQLPLAGHRLLCRMRRRPLLCRSPSESSRAGKLLTGPDPAQGGAQEAIDPTYIYRSCSPDNQARICNPLLFLQCKVHQ